MINSEMKIEQTDNGWVLEFLGHDHLAKRVVCLSWKAVLKELNEYFGWYDFDGHLRKTP